MKATITAVRPERRFTTGDGGEMADLPVAFADGSVGHVYGVPGKMPSHLEALTKLIGTESEFDLEEGKPYQGQANWKIKRYEGDPRQQGKGGGKGGWQPRSIEERNEIIALNALNNAVALTTAMLGPEGGSQDRTWTWIEDSTAKLQERFFLATIQLARQSSGAEAHRLAALDVGAGKSAAYAGVAGSVPEPSLGESGEGDKPGSPESSEGGGRDRPAVGVSGNGAEPLPSAAGLGLNGESAAAPSDPSPSDTSPASPTQLDRLEHVYGGRTKAIRAAFQSFHYTGTWEEMTSQLVSDLITAEKVAL